MSTETSNASENDNLMTLTVQELQEKINFDDAPEENPLWKHVLPQRLASTVASNGVWLASGEPQIQCISHVEVISETGRIHLFCRDPLDERAVRSALKLLESTVQLLWENVKDNVDLPLKFSALDRRLFPAFQSFVKGKYTIKSSYEAPCGVWLYDGSVSGQDSEIEQHAMTIRPLTLNDAQLVDSRWTYRSDTSITMVKKMIKAPGAACYGLEDPNGRLVAWVCQYLDGPLGMLWTEEDSRGKGYASLLVETATRRPKQGPWIGFIVDNNTASERVFTKLHWTRVMDADWVGFTVEKKKD